MCNPSIQEAEAGELRVWGKPKLHHEILSEKKEKKKKQIQLLNSLKIQMVPLGRARSFLSQFTLLYCLLQWLQCWFIL
jgi:hypothetical protein